MSRVWLWAGRSDSVSETGWSLGVQLWSEVLTIKGYGDKEMYTLTAPRATKI